MSDFPTTIIRLVIPRFVRKKFAGVQQPLGGWILRHVLEFVFLSPAIILTWIWLKLRRIDVLQIGESPVISRFIAPLEPELQRRFIQPNSLNRTLVLNLAVDANSQIRQMYDRLVKIYGNEKLLRRRLLWWASRLARNYKVLREEKSDLAWSSNVGLHKLTSAEESLGKRFLAQHGLGEGQEYLCYAVRSESYYLRLAEQGVAIKPRSVRNPSESVYLAALSDFSKEDFIIFRMGKDLDQALEFDKDLPVIDYAMNFRSDFLDVFLLDKCKFLLVGNTGLFWIRAIFKKPTLHCDLYDIRHQVLFGDLMIFQKVLMKNEGRLATVSEMLKMRSEYSDERHQSRLGVELIKNTADEILAVCREMNDRIDGTWATTPEDEVLQQKYLDLVVKYSDQPTWRGGGRVGTQFLRDNQDLLR